MSKNENQFFYDYSKIASTYGVFDDIFGIYAQSYVYMDTFGVISCFSWMLSSGSCFRRKTGFCFSRTAESVLGKTDRRTKNSRSKVLPP